MYFNYLMTEDILENFPKILENNININEESLVLREIFNKIEENQRIKIKDKNNKIVFTNKFKIRSNLNILNRINDMKSRPKNKYKLKLQKIITPKKLTN